MNPKKIRYGITKSVKGRYFDLALYNIKYIHSIQYPETFLVELKGGKFGQIKSNNIRIFKRLKVISKLKFDPKNQWLTKFSYIHTIKPSLQCCYQFSYIGLNIIKSMKQLKNFDYNFPYRLSFDQNKLKDINFLKYSKELKTIKLHIDSFDNKIMYKKLFSILKRNTQLESVIFIKINFGLALPYLEILQSIPQLKISNEIQFQQVLKQNKHLQNLLSLACFTASNCLQVLNHFHLFKSLRRLELNDFIVPESHKSDKEFTFFNRFNYLEQLQTLILELNFTKKKQTSLFFQHFNCPNTLKALELTLLNLSFEIDEETTEQTLAKSIGEFCNNLESLKQLTNLKMCFSIYSNFKYVNNLIGYLPINLPLLQRIDCLFRTDNEYDNPVYLDGFIQWASQLKSLTSMILRTTNLTIENNVDCQNISFKILQHIKLAEEYGRKSQQRYQDTSKMTVEFLNFMKRIKSLEEMELNLNFNDLSDSFQEVLYSLFSNMPEKLKKLKLRVVNKNLNLVDAEIMKTQITKLIESLQHLRALELNLPVFFKCELESTYQYQQIVIPGVWKNNITGVIYEW